MSTINEHGGASHGSMKTYLIGFVLSVILTLIPFCMVMTGSASHHTLIAVVVASAVIQIIVHLICFLHMNTSSEDRWNLVAFIFTLIVIIVVVGGSLWIMWNLNMNMMVD